MLAQVPDEPENSDSSGKSVYDSKVSGGAKSAADLGGLSGRQGEERNKKSSFVTRFSICCLARRCPLWTPEQGFWRLLAFYRGVAPLIRV